MSLQCLMQFSFFYRCSMGTCLIFATPEVHQMPPFLQHSVFEILSGCQGVCYFPLLGFKASIDFDEMVTMGLNSNSPSTYQQASLSLPSLAPRHCLCFLSSSVEIACFTRDNDLQDNNWQPPYIPSIQTPRCLTYGTMLASIMKRAGLLVLVFAIYLKAVFEIGFYIISVSVVCFQTNSRTKCT